MKPLKSPHSSHYLLLFCWLLLLQVLISSSSSLASSDSTYDNFLQCLQNQTSSNNVSSILYSKQNTQYTPVLEAYIRNLRFNYPTTPKPTLIITPLNPSQVAASVTCSRVLNLHLITRSGGHDFEGLSYTTTNKFVILDMSRLRDIRVDPKAATAYVQSGAILGELYYKIQEKSNVLGFPAGVCPTVGVGGHFSGGGYGNMIRKHGLTVDHVIDAEVIDATGRILNRTTMGEDLFWAIRGGGGASFAVVVSYTVRLVPVPKTVTVFNVKRFESDNATDLVHKWQFLMKDIDHNLFIRLLLQPQYDPQLRARLLRVTFMSLFLGDSNTLLTLLDRAFPELRLTKSDCLEMTWAQSVLYWTNLDPNNTPFEVLLNRTYDSDYLKRKSDYVQTPIPKSGLDLLWKKLVNLTQAGLVFNSYGGRMNEIPATATAFPHRAGNLFKIQYSIQWHEAGEAEDEKSIKILRELHSFMTPYVSQNPARGAYLNYRDLDIGVSSKNWSYSSGEVYGRKYFLGNFDRLVKVKSMVDPDNFFRNEQSIPVMKSVS